VETGGLVDGRWASCRFSSSNLKSRLESFTAGCGLPADLQQSERSVQARARLAGDRAVSVLSGSVPLTGGGLLRPHHYRAVRFCEPAAAGHEKGMMRILGGGRGWAKIYESAADAAADASGLLRLGRC